MIGSGLVWGLNQQGVEDILVVDHLGCSEKWKNLRSLRFRDYVEKDVFREMLVNGAFDNEPIEGILHMGACSSTTEKDATYLVDNNYNATKELALFAMERDIRMLYASSCATYGGGEHGYNDDEADIPNLRPLNMYGYSKQLFDLFAMNNNLFDNGNLVGCKFSNVYGPNELHKGEMRSVICRAYEQLSAGEKLKLFKSYRPEYADGEQVRDFLYVKDAVDMVLYLFDHESASGIYNVGSGKAESWNKLAKAVYDAFGRPFEVEYIEMPEYLRGKYQYYTKARMDKLKTLGYDKEPMSLEAAIRDYICEYRMKDKYLGD